MCSRSCPARNSSAKARILSWDEKSQRSDSTEAALDRLRTSSTLAAVFAGSRPTITRLAPSCASLTDVCKPIPLVAPVIRTVFPVRSAMALEYNGACQKTIQISIGIAARIDVAATGRTLRRALPCSNELLPPVTAVVSNRCRGTGKRRRSLFACAGRHRGRARKRALAGWRNDGCPALLAGELADRVQRAAPNRGGGSAPGFSNDHRPRQGCARGVSQDVEGAMEGKRLLRLRAVASRCREALVAHQGPRAAIFEGLSAARLRRAGGQGGLLASKKSDSAASREGWKARPVFVATSAFQDPNRRGPQQVARDWPLRVLRFRTDALDT